jgi:hypothetical protein
MPDQLWGPYISGSFEANETDSATEQSAGFPAPTTGFAAKPLFFAAVDETIEWLSIPRISDLVHISIYLVITLFRMDR